MKVDITTSVIQYTTEDLIRYARQGLLYVGDYCLSDFVDKILYESSIKVEILETDYNEAIEEARKEGFDDAVNDIRGYLENM